MQGLAEGQGNKDISDQLEDEDQLLGASRPDQTQARLQCLPATSIAQHTCMAASRDSYL